MITSERKYLWRPRCFERKKTGLRRKTPKSPSAALVRREGGRDGKGPPSRDLLTRMGADWRDLEAVRPTSRSTAIRSGRRAATSLEAESQTGSRTDGSHRAAKWVAAPNTSSAKARLPVSVQSITSEIGRMRRRRINRDPQDTGRTIPSAAERADERPLTPAARLLRHAPGKGANRQRGTQGGSFLIVSGGSGDGLLAAVTLTREGEPEAGSYTEHTLRILFPTLSKRPSASVSVPG